VSFLAADHRGSAALSVSAKGDQPLPGKPPAGAVPSQWSLSLIQSASGSLAVGMLRRSGCPCLPLALVFFAMTGKDRTPAKGELSAVLNQKGSRSNSPREGRYRW